MLKSFIRGVEGKYNEMVNITQLYVRQYEPTFEYVGSEVCYAVNYYRAADK